MNKCYLCGTEGVMTHLDLYLTGSEGIHVCHYCRVVLTKVAEGIKLANTKGIMEGKEIMKECKRRTNA